MNDSNVENADGALDWYTEMLRLYQVGISHTFLLTGNVSDAVGSDGGRLTSVRNELAARRDDNFAPQEGNREIKNVMLEYSPSHGYEFPWAGSEKELNKSVALPEKGMSPLYLIKLLDGLRDITLANRIARARSQKLEQRYRVTVFFGHADQVFPMGSEGSPWTSAMMRWIGDPRVGDSGILILMAPKMEKIASCIREHPAVQAITIPKPDLDCRLRWLESFDSEIRKKGALPPLDGRQIRSIDLAPDYDLRSLAESTEGFRLRDVRDLVMHSLVSRVPINEAYVLQHQASIASNKALKLIEQD